MAENGIIEKFPDSWDPQYLWTVFVENLSDNHPVDILIKRLVFLPSFSYLFSFVLFLIFLIQDKSSYIPVMLTQSYRFFLHYFQDGVIISGFKMNQLYFFNTPPTFLFIFFTRIFLSYQSRQVNLETKLESKLESVDSCGCLISDGSFPGASDPYCPFIRRKEVFQFLV